MALSLLDDIGEMVVKDSVPEEVDLDAIVGEGDIIEGKNGSKQSTVITNIGGEFWWNHL